MKITFYLEILETGEKLGISFRGPLVSNLKKETNKRVSTTVHKNRVVFNFSNDSKNTPKREASERDSILKVAPRVYDSYTSTKHSNRFFSKRRSIPEHMKKLWEIGMKNKMNHCK